MIDFCLKVLIGCGTIAVVLFLIVAIWFVIKMIKDEL